MSQSVQLFQNHAPAFKHAITMELADLNSPVSRIALLVLCGVPAAGKSTIAQLLCRTAAEHAPSGECCRFNVIWFTDDNQLSRLVQWKLFTSVSMMCWRRATQHLSQVSLRLIWSAAKGFPSPVYLNLWLQCSSVLAPMCVAV